MHIYNVHSMISNVFYDIDDKFVIIWILNVIRIDDKYFLIIHIEYIHVFLKKTNIKINIDYFVSFRSITSTKKLWEINVCHLNNYLKLYVICSTQKMNHSLVKNNSIRNKIVRILITQLFLWSIYYSTLA